MLRAADLLCQSLPHQPYSGASPAALAALLSGEIFPENASGLEELEKRLRQIVPNSVVVSHPHTAAHLHCPPLIAALAAEVLISALNQ